MARFFYWIGLISFPFLLAIPFVLGIVEILEWSDVLEHGDLDFEFYLFSIPFMFVVGCISSVTIHRTLSKNRID